MASVASMSESIQASIIIQQQQLQQQEQYGPRHRSQQQHHQYHQQHQQQLLGGVGYCVQVLLVAALGGMEMCMCFEQIYQVLFLQYLGVPLSLVSINGVICGAASMAIIPVAGYLSDKGSNPKNRKMVAIYVGMSIFLLALLILAACGFIKISLLETLKQDMGTSSTNASSHITAAPFPEAAEGNVSPNLITDKTGVNSTSDSGLPVTAFLSICGFALVDVGYDTSMSLTRAYVIESVPKFQHLKVLVTASIIQSMSGTILSFLGVFDVSAGLGQLFGVDGTAAVLIFFCFILCILVSAAFVSTAVTGHHLTRASKLQITEDGKHTSQSSSRASKAVTDNKFRRNRPYNPDIHHTESKDTYSKPLTEDSLKSQNYSTMEVTSSWSTVSSLRAETIPALVANRGPRKISNDESSPSGKVQDAMNYETLCETEEPDLDEEKSHASSEDQEESPLIPKSPLGDFHSKRLAQLQPKETSKKDDEDNRKLKVKTRLAILTVASFFMAGATLAFTYYAPNVLTVGIYHGVPTALPGTPGKELYEKGLRRAALGNLVMYIMFTLVSLNYKKIIDLIGEKLPVLISHVLLFVALVALILTQMEEIYFLVVVAVGLFRPSVFTMPFVLANKFSQEAEDNSSSESKAPIRGKIMALIGFLLPAHYILLSAVMGPLLEATGNAWVPIYYSLSCCTIAMLVFSLLFVIK